jgi:hypothetical protein
VKQAIIPPMKSVIAGILLMTVAAGCATGPGGLPYATKVDGKPGIVLSPYSSHIAEIDVRDKKRNDVVTDPFTGEEFLVP